MVPEGARCKPTGCCFPFQRTVQGLQWGLVSVGSLAAEAAPWWWDLLEFCVLRRDVPWTGKTLVRKGQGLQGRGTGELYLNPRKGGVQGCVARHVGLASLRFGCRLDPCSAPHPQGRASHLAKDSTQTTATCGSKTQPLRSQAGAAGCLRHPSSFLHRAAVLQRGGGGCLCLTPASCSFSAPPLPTLPAQTLVSTPTTAASCHPVGTWHGVRGLTVPK